MTVATVIGVFCYKTSTVLFLSASPLTYNKLTPVVNMFTSTICWLVSPNDPPNFWQSCCFRQSSLFALDRSDSCQVLNDKIIKLLLIYNIVRVSLYWCRKKEWKHYIILSHLMQIIKRAGWLLFTPSWWSYLKGWVWSRSSCEFGHVLLVSLITFSSLWSWGWHGTRDKPCS